METSLDMDKIARGLGAKRRGKVRAAGGYFGAAGLVADVQARFRVPRGGGRATDPRWTERRLLPLTPQTLRRLDELSTRVRQRTGVRIGLMQLAALLVERETEHLSTSEVDDLVETMQSGPRSGLR